MIFEVIENQRVEKADRYLHYWKQAWYASNEYAKGWCSGFKNALMVFGFCIKWDERSKHFIIEVR